MTSSSRFTGMQGISAMPSYVILQPTTLCNLDCTYCYLPLRHENRRMSTEVARAAAVTVNEWAAQVPRFSVVWHGGEPLATGRRRFAELMAPFVGVEHHVQTNATLIDDEWCAFIRDHDIHIGLSVDGPRAYTANRIDRSGREAYDRILRGTDTLRRHGVPFAALCVVSDPSPELAARLYPFFLELGCYALGINIEEREGVNTRDTAYTEDRVRGFWAELTRQWRAAPRIELRDVEFAVRYLAEVVHGDPDTVLPRQVDPIPTIGYDGSVVLLSPELAGFTSPQYGDFASGNVTTTRLDEIIATATRSGWVAEYLRGIEACRAGCAYFGFCGGGHAANRYFEHGRFDTTVTDHCRNSKIRLLEGVLDHAGSP
jgi:uncharacterized protein